MMKYVLLTILLTIKVADASGMVRCTQYCDKYGYCTTTCFEV